MKVVTLASSSKGNCILVFNENTKILIDAGIKLAEINAKLKALNIEPGEINAILVTHEHSDHVKSVGAMCRKFGTRVYVFNEAKQEIVKTFGNVDEFKIVETFLVPFQIGEFIIKPFKVPHDSKCCVGYSISENDKKISIATDIGFVSGEILSELKGSLLVVLESNHDEQMLIDNPNYPAILKNRILSNHGHLSNINCAKAIEYLCGFGLKQVVCAHLSEENNTPSLCFNTIKKYLFNKNIIVGENVKVDIASPNKIGTIFNIVSSIN